MSGRAREVLGGIARKYPKAAEVSAARRPSKASIVAAAAAEARREASAEAPEKTAKRSTSAIAANFGLRTKATAGDLDALAKVAQIDSGEYVLRDPSNTKSLLAKALTSGNPQQIKDFFKLRAQHTLAELIHDFTKAFVDEVLPTRATKLALVRIIVQRAFNYTIGGVETPFTPFTDGEHEALCVDLVDSFYPTCTSDAAVKKIIKEKVDLYLRKYEDISSLDELSSDPHSTDNEASENQFFELVRSILEPDKNGDAALYLDAQFGNLLLDYYMYRKKLPGINYMCKDKAEDADPGSGWDPKSLYGIIDVTAHDEYFPSACTGLGRGLRLFTQNKVLFGRWDGDEFILKIERGTNSVNATADLLRALFRLSNQAPGSRTTAAALADIAKVSNLVVLRDPLNFSTLPQADFYAIIFSVLLLKTAGDRCQTYSVNSSIWEILASLTPKFPFLISNDILAIIDFLLYWGRGVINTGMGSNRIYQPTIIGEGNLNEVELINLSNGIRNWIDTTLPADNVIRTSLLASYPLGTVTTGADAINALRIIAGPGGAAIFRAYATALIKLCMEKTARYLTNTFTALGRNQLIIFTKAPLLEEGAADIDNIIPSNADRFVYDAAAEVVGSPDTDPMFGEMLVTATGPVSLTGMKANKLLAGTLTFIIDFLEKAYIYESMVSKTSDRNLESFDTIVTDLGAGIVSRKFKSLVYETINGVSHPINMYKYTDLYSVYSAKASYQKLAKQLSMFEAQLTDYDVDSHLPRCVIYNTLVDILKSTTTSEIPFELIAFALAFLVYDVTKTTTSIKREDIDGLPIRTRERVRKIYAEIDKRNAWIADVTPQDSVLRSIILQIFNGFLTGEITTPAGVVTNRIEGTRNYTSPQVYTELNAFTGPVIYNTMTITGTVFGSTYNNVKNTAVLSTFEVVLKRICAYVISFDIPFLSAFKIPPLVGVDTNFIKAAIYLRTTYAEVDTYLTDLNNQLAERALELRAELGLKPKIISEKIRKGGRQKGGSLSMIIQVGGDSKEPPPLLKETTGKLYTVVNSENPDRRDIVSAFMDLCLILIAFYDDNSVYNMGILSRLLTIDDKESLYKRMIDTRTPMTIDWWRCDEAFDILFIKALQSDKARGIIVDIEGEEREEAAEESASNAMTANSSPISNIKNLRAKRNILTRRSKFAPASLSPVDLEMLRRLNEELAGTNNETSVAPQHIPAQSYEEISFLPKLQRRNTGVTMRDPRTREWSKVIDTESSAVNGAEPVTVPATTTTSTSHGGARRATRNRSRRHLRRTRRRAAERSRRKMTRRRR